MKPENILITLEVNGHICTCCCLLSDLFSPFPLPLLLLLFSSSFPSPPPSLHSSLLPPHLLLLPSPCPQTDNVKLADFGSCKSINSKHPYTEYISTRWYAYTHQHVPTVRTQMHSTPQIYMSGTCLAHVWLMQSLEAMLSTVRNLVLKPVIMLLLFGGLFK